MTLTIEPAGVPFIRAGTKQCRINLNYSFTIAPYTGLPAIRRQAIILSDAGILVIGCEMKWLVYVTLVI